MKRDMELIRDILLEIENDDTIGGPQMNRRSRASSL